MVLDNKSSKILDKLKEASQGGINVEVSIPLLKELREVAKSQEDALVTRVLRQTYEHLEENEDFTVDYFTDGFVGEEGEEMPTDKTSYEYLLDLVENSDNKYNREELRIYKHLLKE